MKKLNDKQLERINGGVSTLAVVGIASAVLFLCGIFEGIVYPKPCE